jgi:hypothetical protein
MSLKRNYLLSLLGLVLSGFGGGMISVHYIIGNSSPINSINALGLVVAVIGMGITIVTLSKLKGKWDFEVIEE